MSCFLFKQKTAYEMRISDWSSDVCSSDLVVRRNDLFLRVHHEGTAGYDRLAERLAREDDGAHAVSAARQRNDALLVGSRQPGDLARSDLGVGPANHAVALDDDDEAVIPCRQPLLERPRRL